MTTPTWIDRVTCPGGCDRPSPADLVSGRCSGCGTQLAFTPAPDGHVRVDRGGPWRYSDWLPCSYRATLDPGSSIRVVAAPALAEVLGIAAAWVVDCTALGTGTFKDLEAQVALAAAADLGLDALAVASTGNTAHAYHEWAVRSDARCLVAVPAAHRAKLGASQSTDRQPIMFVDGPPAANAAALRERAMREGATQLGPAWKLEGAATIAYAIAEHCPTANVVAQTIGSGFGPLGYELGLRRARAIAPLAGAPVTTDHEYLLFQPADAAIMARAWDDPTGVPDLGALPDQPFEPTLQSTNGPATIAALRRLPVRALRAVDPADVAALRPRVDALLSQAGITLDYALEKSTYIALTGLLAADHDPGDRLAVIVTGAVSTGAVAAQES